MEVINLKSKGSQIPNLYQYEVVAKMNSHNFTLVRVKDRTLDFHTHPDSDEVFLVVDGQMKLEFKDQTVQLNAGEMCVVPKGVEHRPICTSEVTCLLIEQEGTLTPANTGGTYEEIHIRKAQINEAPLLAKIIARSHRDVADQFNLTPQNCPKHPSNCQEDWVENDFQRGVTYYLLDCGDKPVGCVAVERADDKQFYLERLSVLPAFRHKGYGKALVDYVLNLAKKDEATTIGIGTIAEHSLLTNWYKEIGFVEKGTKTFAHLPFTVLFMEYNLPDVET